MWKRPPLVRVARQFDHHDLEREAWTSSAPSRDALDAAIYRLRRRLTGVGLYVRTIRGRGFALIVA